MKDNMTIIIFIGLLFLSAFVWVMAGLLSRIIKRSDVNVIDEFMLTRLSWKGEKQDRLAKLTQLKLILSITTIGSLVISLFALTEGMRNSNNPDGSITTAFYLSSGSLLFSALYCSALWFLIAKTLRALRSTSNDNNNN